MRKNHNETAFNKLNYHMVMSYCDIVMVRKRQKKTVYKCGKNIVNSLTFGIGVQKVFRVHRMAALIINIGHIVRESYEELSFPTLTTTRTGFQT